MTPKFSKIIKWFLVMTLLSLTACSAVKRHKDVQFYIMPSIAPAMAFQSCIRKSGISDAYFKSKKIKPTFTSDVLWENEEAQLTAFEVNVDDPDKMHQNIYTQCQSEAKLNSKKIRSNQAKQEALPSVARVKLKSGMVYMSGDLFPLRANQIHKDKTNELPLDLSYEERP